MRSSGSLVSEPWWVDHVEIYAGGALYPGLWDSARLLSFLFPFTMAQAHYDIYREQLENLHYGHALWEPSPAGLYDRVRVGDVGFVRSGHFMRLFNVLLPANDPNQGYELPPNFVPLNMGHFQNIRVLPLPYGDYYSTTVVATRDAIGAQIQAAYVTDQISSRSFC